MQYKFAKSQAVAIGQSICCVLGTQPFFNEIMTSDLLLSICIPTFNRPHELSESLRILGDELKRLKLEDSDSIAILVSDNNSDTYNVDQLVLQQSELKNLSIFKQEKNIGASSNFEFCYKQATGKYVWILSDDDHVKQGMLEKVLNIINGQEPDLVFLPFSCQNETNDFSLRMERNQFLLRTGVLPTLVSSWIVRRSLIEKKFGNYIDSNLHQYYYFLCAVEAGENFVYVQQQVLYCPYENNSGGYNWFSTFCASFYRIINEFPAKKIHRRTLRHIQNKMLIDRIVPTYFNTRIDGFTISDKFDRTKNIDIISLVFRYTHKLLAFWLVFIPIAIIPVALLNRLKSLYLWQKSFLFKWH